jgi:tetratricopeptide (TPR) repeat protein
MNRSLALLALLACATCLPGCAKPAPVYPKPGASELMQRGVFLADQGDDFGAEQYFVAARSAGYPEPRIVRELVHVCVGAGRLEQALTHAQSYLDRNPDDWALRHVLASIEFAKGDRLGARHELTLVLAEHPEHAESTFLLALVLRDGFADFAGATAIFQRYLELAPAGAHANETRAWLRRAASFPVATPVETSAKEATP